MYYAVIVAGGSGTRLWPFSRQTHPKQALKLVGERTMMQHAVDRLAPLFSPDQVFVVTRRDHVPVLSEQVPNLPAANFIVEPQARGTAAAIGLAAIRLHKCDRDAVMAVLTADHFITNTERFRESLATAAQVAEDGYLVTLGITPSAPSTGFGYIQQGNSLGSTGGFPVFQVAQFAEKPDQDTAQQMVQSGEFSWNSGMFIWRVDHILAEFERQMPRLYAQLQDVGEAIGTARYADVINRVWPEIVKQTIDYGVMEHARKVAVIPVEIGWSDVGSWSSLTELIPADAQGNVSVGKHVEVDTTNALIVSDDEDRLIATIGLHDVVIVAMNDAVLVCPKEREQEVRQIVKHLEATGQNRWL